MPRTLRILNGYFWFVRKLTLLLFLSLIYTQAVSACVIDWTLIKNEDNSERCIELLDSISNSCDLSGVDLKKWNHLRGMHCIYLTRYEEAQEHFQNGLLLARQSESDTFQAIFTNQVGVLNYSIGKRPESMKWFKQAAQLGSEYGLERLEGVALNNVGSMYTELGEYDSAEVFLRRALLIWKNRGDKSIGLYLHTMRILATNYEQIGEYEKSLQMFKDILHTSKKHHDTASIGRTLVFMSIAEARLGMVDSALFHARLGLDLQGRDSSNKDNLITSLDAWANANQVAGNYKEAMLAFANLRALDKEVFSENLELKLGEKEAEFNTESERQQRQIAEAEAQAERQKATVIGILSGLVLLLILLGLAFYVQRQKRKLAEKDIAIQKERLAAVLEGEERERSRVARDLHDGISQMLFALKMNFNASGVDDTASLDLLDKSIQEVRSISHNLLPKTLGSEGLITALNQMATQLTSTGSIDISFESYKDELDISSEIQTNLFRIVQELLNNVIKHANATHVWIKLEYENSLLKLSVKDNGSGLRKEIIEEAKGIGWKNIQARLEILGGNVSLAPSDKDTQLNFTFPISIRPST